MANALQGGPQFVKTMRELSFEDQRKITGAMLVKAGLPIEGRMSELAPIEPGAPDLKDSIRTQLIRKFEDPDVGEVELGDAEVAVAIGPTKAAFYGFFQEFGVPPHGDHPGHPAQPFARPAFDEKVDGALRSLQGDIWAYIRKTASRSVTGRGL